MSHESHYFLDSLSSEGIEIERVLLPNGLVSESGNPSIALRSPCIACYLTNQRPEPLRGQQ